MSMSYTFMYLVGDISMIIMGLVGTLPMYLHL